MSGSAVGYYGDRGDLELSESSSCGEDFAAQLCAAWEKSALPAKQFGVRVCLLRTGLVLSNEGGLIQRMLWPFKLGLGTRLGNGNQWMSWIHIDDYVNMVLRLLHDPSLSNAFNLTAPSPVTNAMFTQQLANALQRPAFLVAPKLFLKGILGERAVLLLEGQRVLPNRFQHLNFNFRYSTLDSALAQLLHH